MDSLYEPQITVETLAKKIAEGAGDRDLSQVTFPEAPRLYAAPTVRPRRDGGYDLNDLLAFRDRDFVEVAYASIFQRPADTAGLEHYLERLRQGEIDRLELLRILWSSSEGRAKGVRVSGLRLTLFFKRAGRVPLIGSFVRLIEENIYLPLKQRHRAWLERQNFVREEKIADQTDHETIQVEASLRPIYQSLAEVAETLHAQQRQMNHLQKELEATLNEMRARVVELGERMTKSQSAPIVAAANPPEMTQAQRSKTDALYAAFTDVFRGPRSEIKERLRVYLPIIRKGGIGTKEMPILDLGSGRGEWLELLGEENLEARGVDLNRIFVAESRAHNFEVAEEDVMAHLRNLPSASIGAITSFHLVEHLPAEVLLSFLDETVRVLKPGGLVILETPNPQNIYVAAYSFHFDLSHHKPLPIETLRFLLESKGLERIETVPLHPVPDQVSGESELIERFNSFFYSAMDYGLVGWKAAG